MKRGSVSTTPSSTSSIFCIAQVTLLRDESEVYGPMSLAPAE
ncbi:hypothetical protein F4560_008214 [Saccharothrix ecbatanensis]|uniref:Uncharacterized protein n=1 Tax=Saccharothrix ecbatanensis TaxID=1105145 RepID=A0A7W9HUN0_9PSEU|nr:hypothetical protein [Saccharothrix ecbatanensis]MBB5808446.1 hypothetical protein [Saccharothrix ecbatanensis]